MTTVRKRKEEKDFKKYQKKIEALQKQYKKKKEERIKKAISKSQK